MKGRWCATHDQPAIVGRDDCMFYIPEFGVSENYGCVIEGGPKVLVIDDIRTFTFEAAYARTSQQGLEMLSGGEWDEVWLDHDLGWGGTIMPVVAVMEERGFNGDPFPVGRVVIHTSNPVGRANIARALERYYTIQQAQALEHM